MNKKTNCFLFCIVILNSLLCFAQQIKPDNKQNPTIDSLFALLKNISLEKKSETKTDITSINTLNALATEFINNKPDTAISLSVQALKMAEKLPVSIKKEESTKQKLIAKSYNNLGAANKFKSNYSLSIDYFFKAFKIDESLNDKKKMSEILGTIGVIYDDQGESTKALDYYLKALKIAEELGDKKGIARHLGNIGVVYQEQGNYPKALDYYFKALKIENALKNKNGIARGLANIGFLFNEKKDYQKALDYDFKALKIGEELINKNFITAILGNIGNTYFEQNNFQKALPYYQKAEKMAEELGDEKITATNLGNIGAVYQEKAIAAKFQQNFSSSDSLYTEALNYFLQALKINKKLGDKNGIASHLGNIGALYTATKKYEQAEMYLKKALTLCDSIGTLNYKMQFENDLSELYEQTNRPAQSLEHYKKYIIAKDSLFNEENTKKAVRSEMNFEFEKKQAVEKAEQEKQNAIAQQEKQKQKIILVLLSCFLLLVAVFASFMFNRWRITQKQKSIIEKQKEKIVDSITYAQLIQQSILMEESEIQKILPHSFIYFQPKDIVSGDFYWCSTVNNKIIIAAIDCTGHGVPGAFMSMIGNTLLNQIVNEKQITTPSEILKQLNIGVTEALHQKKDGALSNDGMDIALCTLDYSTDQIQYAGAQNPLYVVADNEITVINADSKSIGGDKFISKKKYSATAEYTNQIFQIKKDMSIFLFSDGYMDQFGSKDRKKFGVQKFKELLLNNQPLNMQQQKEAIAKAHENWKGNTAQIDDILVIGLRL